MSASIINTYPTTLQNGQLEDATVVMTLFAWIQSQVNGNACGATTGSNVLKGDGAGNTAPAIAGTDYLGVTSGLIFDYAGITAPSGYLLCDGSAVSRVTYADLFNAIGTTWGVGDGSTTFNVPDLRRKTTIGSGGTALSGPSNTVGSAGGAETHVISGSELPTHNHVVNINDPGHFHYVPDPGHTHDFSSTLTPYTLAGGAVGLVRGNGNTPVASGNQISPTLTGIGNTNPSTTFITATSNNAGSSTAMSLMQPTAVVTKIIKV